MKRRLCAAAALSAFAAGPLASTAADTASPVGTWQLSTGESRYEVVHCNDSEICARLTWLRDDARTAENVRYLNTYILKGAHQVRGNRWEGTVVYEGDNIDGTMTLIDADTMRLTGCRLLCQSFEFTRL